MDRAHRRGRRLVKLPKLTRKRIYAAAPASVEIKWPLEIEPKVGNRYTIQTETGAAGLHRLVVLGASELAKGWKATVCLEGDRVLLLGKNGGYVENHLGAIGSSSKPSPGSLREEPEAVDPGEIENYRTSKEARIRRQSERAEEVGQILAAMQDLRNALDSMNPETRQRISRSVFVLRSRLNTAERDLRRDIAA
jgi:hypothetical protein